MTRSTSIAITLAFAQMAYYIFARLTRYGGDDGLTIYKRSQFVEPIDFPNKVQFYYICIARLKESGLAILVIDKNVGALIRVADRHFLIERRRVVWTGALRYLAAASAVQHRYLGV